MPTQPTPEQFQTLFEKAPPGPLIMLNLLKFKEKGDVCVRSNGLWLL